MREAAAHRAECYDSEGSSGRSASGDCGPPTASSTIGSLSLLLHVSLLLSTRSCRPASAQAALNFSKGSSESSKRGSRVAGSSTIARRTWWPISATPDEGRRRRGEAAQAEHSSLLRAACSKAASCALLTPAQVPVQSAPQHLPRMPSCKPHCTTTHLSGAAAGAAWRSAAARPPRHRAHLLPQS